VNQQLRTTPVLALCRQMLDTRDFGLMPILADALQDGGCADEEVLRQCRDPDLHPVLAERIVNLSYSDETAAAVRWLERFAHKISFVDVEYSYGHVVEIGHDGESCGSMFFGTDAGADFFRESEENRREFFRNWSLVTGVAVPDETREAITFRCAC
jgi:hypothetical protein